MTSTFWMRPFTFSAYLTTWPQMTFDLGIWPLIAWTYDGSHITSIHQVWFKSDFNFSNEAIFTFSAYLTTWPQMTFGILWYMWALKLSTNEGSHVASITQLVELHQSTWKLEPNVNPFSQQQQTTVDTDVSFLLRQATQKIVLFAQSFNLNDDYGYLNRGW